MKMRNLSLLLFACLAASGQDAAAPPEGAASEKAPPEVEAALRARVDKFYQAHVSGKFRDAFVLVAEDSQDAFLGAGNDKYESCQTAKIAYSERFTKADVVENCKGEYRWHGQRIPVTLPLTSHWKTVGGEWFWYYVKLTEVMTPWGISRIPADGAAPGAAASGAASPSVIPQNPLALAKDILSQVKIDKTEVRLKSSELSRDEVLVVNGMPGQIAIAVDYVGQPGLSIKPEKSQLSAGEKTRVVFKYDPEDAAVACGECAKRIKSALTATVRVSPTGQKFPVTVIFGIPPELEKQLPAK